MQIKQSDWLKIRSGCGILIYSAGQGLRPLGILFPLTYSTLHQIFNTMFLLFPRKEDLYEMSNSVFWENKKNIINLLPAELAERVIKVNL